MEGKLLDQYQLRNSSSTYIPKVSFKDYIEENYVKEIYIAYGTEMGIDVTDSKYREYISQNYKDCYATIKPMKSSDLWKLALSGGCLLEASNYKNAMKMLSIIKAAVNKLLRSSGYMCGTEFHNTHSHGCLNILHVKKKQEEKYLIMQLVYDQVRSTVLMEISE